MELPERSAATQATNFFEELKTSILLESDSIRVESCKKAHNASNRLFGCMTELTGVTATFRHQLESRDKEVQELMQQLARFEKETSRKKERKLRGGSQEADVLAFDWA